jgi:adenylate cyclase
VPSTDTPSTVRRLAAIAVLDVVGYSRMMAEDEEATYAAFVAHRNAIDPVLLNHGCRIVKGTGDGVLVEVPSAVEAVRAAIEVQELMAERNASAPEGRRMQLRIGINLGDIIVDEDGDVHGDGVNIAVRLEGEANPGGVCISDVVHKQLQGRVDAHFTDGGSVAVKNIPAPVHVWKTKSSAQPAMSRDVERGTYTAIVAVFPFDEMSGDENQRYFVDGITEDLITALSRYPDLRVIARNSTFAYLGRVGDVRAVARELDATHVVEGSVRRAGDQVRVSAQLIEAESGHHIWAERYDRDLADVFEVQDEIVREIAAHIHPAIERVEGEKRARADPAGLDAWDLLLRSRWQYHTNTREGCEEAIRLAELAVERDPSFALAHAGLVAYWITAGFNRWHIGERRATEEIARHAFIAQELDPHDAVSMSLAAVAHAFARDFEQAEDLSKRAVALAPYDPSVLLSVGAVAYWVGDHDRGVEHLTKAWQLAVHEPWRFHIATNMAFAHYMAGKYEASAVWSELGLAAGDYLQIRAISAATYAQLGRMDEARRHLAHLTADNTDQTASDFLRTNTFKRQEDIDHWKDGLIKAGLPE